MKTTRKWMVVLALMSTSILPAQAQIDWQHQIGENASAAREQWKQLTSGEELAHGKKVFFSPKPNYRLTTDENDPYDLTDGNLSTRTDDRVWFQKDAVGWYLGAGTSGGTLMVIDLGQVQPVGQIAIRVLGGYEQGSLGLPGAAEFLASVDGKQYHQLQRMVKLNPAEKEQADGKTGFYFPEEGKAYMAPLVCREPVQARYIALRITPVNSIFTDQISVQKAPATVKLKNLSDYPTGQVYTDGLVVFPRHEPFVVTSNIATPNWLTVLNNTELELAKGELGYRLDLPEGLTLLPQSQPKFTEVSASRAGVKSYEFKLNRNAGYSSQGSEGPLWIEKSAGAAIAPDAKVTFTATVQGKDSHSVSSPLKIVEVPTVPSLKSLDVSLAWMGDSVQQEWPNFLRDFRKMGFDYISTFPRYYGKDKDGQWNAATQKNLEFIKQARAAGYKVLYNESPFHVMWNTIQADEKAGRLDPAEAEQIYTQIDGKRGKHVNILYRGKYFQDEIKRVAELAALVQPDHVYHDIEFWDGPAAESKRDPRVIAAWKASGKEWDDFATDNGKEILATLNTAMRAAVPGKQMVVGTYNSDPKNKIYNSILQFDKNYPQIVDLAQPSLYVQGRATVVADRIRYDYEAMKNKQIIPWLSAGTYGEFDPYKTEPMVLEAVLNGSRGLTYYWFGDFEPLDFYYHSKALAALAPYETLLQSGKPIAYKGDNSALHYTAFASDKEALVLVGNYDNSANTRVTLSLPFKGANKATLAGKVLSIKGNTVTLDVPRGEFRLVAFSS